MSVTKEQQDQANTTSSEIRKATKILVVIIAGISALYLLKLLKVLLSKKNKKTTEKEAREQIDSIKSQWFIRISKSIDDSWTKGIALGMKASKDQGVQPMGKGSKSSVSIKESILKDVQRAIDDSEKLLTEAVESGSDPEKVNKAITLRLQMSGEASLKNAIAETMESELASPDTQKMWVATSPEPCSHCRKLSGLVRDWGEEFPHSFPGVYKLKVYGGILLGPLRHPNCLCILIRVPKDK